MSFQIANVLLWQKSGRLRNLEFKKNKVNVITGDSGKGKSSILHIIDYCLLASDSKGISKSNIDNKLDWYGIRLWTSRGLVTIARPAVHKGDKNSIFFDDSGTIPSVPTRNMLLKDLKPVMDKEVGLNSQLKIPYGGRTIKAGSKVSFRNFLPFCYQDQSALVASDHLYIKPGDQKLIERIERTFRMAIGIVDLEGAILGQRIEQLKTKQETLERKQSTLSGRKLDFQEDVVSLQDEAVDLGLISEPSTDPEESLTLLKEISKRPITNFSDMGTKIQQLERREFEISKKLSRYRAFNQDYRSYLKVIKESDDSLLSVNYLLENYTELLPSSNTNKVLTALESQLLKIKKDWETHNDSVLFTDINERTNELEKELSDIHQKIEKAKCTSIELSSPERVYKYQGKIEAKMELYSTKSLPTEYNDQLDSINSELAGLEGIAKNIESKRDFVIGNLNEKINLRLESLKLKGYENSKAVFVESQKAINLVLEDGQKIEQMEDIGSASNYLYLHLSYFMSLHQVARRNKVSWLPRFLIFDQVSTPYSGEIQDDIDSLDIALTEINSFVREMNDNGGIQIILMEHIPESHWRSLELENFHLVDRELVGDYGLIN